MLHVRGSIKTATQSQRVFLARAQAVLGLSVLHVQGSIRTTTHSFCFCQGSRNLGSLCAAHVCILNYAPHAIPLPFPSQSRLQLPSTPIYMHAPHCTACTCSRSTLSYPPNLHNRQSHTCSRNTFSDPPLYITDKPPQCTAHLQQEHPQ